MDEVGCAGRGCGMAGAFICSKPIAARATLHLLVVMCCGWPRKLLTDGRGAGVAAKYKNSRTCGLGKMYVRVFFCSFFLMACFSDVGM
jgi:hypothetical protein